MNTEDPRRGLISASEMDSALRCIGRRAIAQRMDVEKRDTKWTVRGSKIHSAMEGEISMEYLSPSDQYTAGQMMNEAARLVDENDMQGAKVIKEQRMWLYDDDFNEILSGQVDEVHLKGDKALIIDFKSGWHVPPPIDVNWQVRTQAVLVKEQYGIKRAVAGLVHPHHPTMKSQIDKEYSEGQIDQFKETILEGIEKMTDDAPRTPNPISCEFCQAKQVCDEYQASLLKNRGKLEKPMQKMTPKERGEYLHLLKRSQDDINEQLQLAKDILRISDKAIEGWILQPSSNSVINNHQKALEIIRTKIGDESAQQCLEVSISLFAQQIQKMGINKKEAEFQAKKILEPVITKKAKDPSLKPK